VTVPRDRVLPKQLPIAMELHQCGLPRAERTHVATAKLRTVLDCALDLPFDAALAVADSALRRGDLTHDQLVSAASRLTGPLAPGARRVAAYADGCASNPFESVLRALAIEAGLDVVPQFEIQVGALTFHADLANPLLGIVLEADSWTWHTEKPDHDRDCVRYNAMSTAGWLVLRFTWQHVMRSPAYVIATIRAAMGVPDGDPGAEDVAA